MTYPIKNFSWKESISQLFGINKSYYEPRYFIPGHNGLDVIIRDEKKGFGTPILSVCNGIVESKTYDVPTRTNGNGVYIYSVELGLTFVYWHLSDFQCEVGQEVKEGDIIGLMGNSGGVFPKPTKYNPYDGTHLHFAILDRNKNNEYNGFIDPVPFLHNGEKLPILLSRDLFFSKEGDDVSNLQTILKLERFAEDYEPIGYFGYKTMKDISKLQSKYQIFPTLGYCGSKTRYFLNKKWSIFYQN